MKKNEIAPLSIAISQTINIALLMPQLNELSRAFPGIQLKIKRRRADDLDRLLKDGEAELAIAGPLGETAGIASIAWPVFEEPFDLARHASIGSLARAGSGRRTEGRALPRVPAAR